MTPTLPEILTGNALVIAGLEQETGGLAYAATRLGVVALLALLAAQEAERGAGAQIAENTAIAAMLADAASEYPAVPQPANDDGDGSLTALDATNAALRRALIALHETVEERGDRARHRAILELYRDMAALRRLDMPQM